MRGHNVARYYQCLMYMVLRIFDALHKKACAWDRGYAELPRRPERRSSENPFYATFSLQWTAEANCAYNVTR
jgi:hypothetical protein